MIAGHFGLAAAVKSRSREAPLWVLMLATVWLDVIFVPLYLSGIETLEPVRGSHTAYGGNVIHADQTHSLVGAVALSALLGMGAWLFWSRRTGIVVALVSFSHWLLDLIVHRGDMPILPGNIGSLPRLGFGLWQLPRVSAAIELLLVLGGAWIYWRAARAVTAQGGRGTTLAALVAVLIAVCGTLVLALDVTRVSG